MSITAPDPPGAVAYDTYEASEIDEPIFENVSLENVHEWPRFGQTPWRFDSAKLEQCSIVGDAVPSVRIWDCVLVRCDLSGTTLFDAGLLRSEFLGCRATGLQLAESTIKDVSFQNCKLNLINFRKCKLQRVVFENCILDAADFTHATLTDVIFRKCELRQTDFNSSKSIRVDMTLNDISEIRGAQSLRNVRILPEQMFVLAPLLCSEIGLVIAD